MAGIDVNRSTAGVYLPPQVSEEIWTNTEYASAAMQLATNIPLPGSGVTVDIITGEPTAEWVAETDEKPVSRPTLGNKLMQPYMLAVIVPFSNQFRRDKARLYQELVRRLPQALARKFDATVFGGDAVPGDNFDTLTDLTAVGLDGDTFGAVVAADAAVAAAGGQLNGWGVAPQGKSLLIGATDGNGRPLFLPDVTSTNSVATVLGAPVYVSKGVYVDGDPAQVGIAGDWSQASWGSVEGVQVSVADQATLTDGDGSTINLWQRNMFAVRAEIEVGFRVRDVDYFVSLTDDEYVAGS